MRLILVIGLLLTGQALSAQTDTLRLIFAGDIMGHTPQIQSAALVPNQSGAIQNVASGGLF